MSYIKNSLSILFAPALLVGNASVFAQCGVNQLGTYQQMLPTLTGPSGSSDFGWDVHNAGDVNLDGTEDLIVGDETANPNGNNSGRVIVYSGANGSILYTFNGTAAGDYYGGSVAGIGDVNGDGYGDVLIGADQFGSSNPSAGGYAEVRSGQTGAVIYTHSAVSPNDRFGIAVESAGDVNRDGIPDYVIGADQFAVGAGYAQVFSGATGAVIFTLSASSGTNDNFGRAVNGAGDVNRDGRDDIIVGAPFDDTNGTDAGRAFIFSGANGSLLHTFSGAAAGDLFGNAVASIGDLDGDARDDVIIGALYEDSANGSDSGVVRVFSGQSGSIIRTHNGSHTSALFGHSVDGVGDVSGDGCPDYIVGAISENANGINSGSARLYSGSSGFVLFTLHGSAGDQVGRSVSKMGSVSGNPLGGFAIGANNASPNGQVKVFGFVPTLP